MRKVIVLTAVAALLLTGLATKCAGRAEAKPESTKEAQLDPFKMAHGRLYLQGGPRHWRACMLQQ
jgi:hypothetical protein